MTEPSNAEHTAERTRLRLYIAGGTPNSLRASANLTALLRGLPDGASRFELEVIDVFKAPLRALDDRVVVTPTLMVVDAESMRAVAGDLGDSARLQDFLLGGDAR